MKKLKLFALTAVALMGVTGVANAETAMLAQDDFVGISFWVISMGMLAATAFFFMERSTVNPAWKTSVTVAGLVTGIAFIHYMYMRDVWVTTGDSPTVYRYIDWLITVPLQMIEFYLILTAVRKANSGIFWRLLIGTLVMLIGGYLGEAGKAASKSGNKALVTAFGAMRMIVTVGWAIYPLGYVFGYLTGGVDANSLNVVYNLADFINKIAFGLVIWAAAVSSAGARAR